MPPAYLKGPEVAPIPSGYHRGCTGKIGHTSRREAARHAIGIKAAHVYHCRGCGQWHVSTQGLPESIRIRRAWGEDV